MLNTVQDFVSSHVGQFTEIGPEVILCCTDLEDAIETAISLTCFSFQQSEQFLSSLSDEELLIALATLERWGNDASRFQKFVDQLFN